MASTRILLFVSLFCQLLVFGLVLGRKSVQCGYDCSAPVPNAFGRSNFNSGGLAGFPLPSTKAFTSQSTIQICFDRSKELTPFLQPQLVNYATENEFYVVCPGDKTINLVAVDSFLGVFSVMATSPIDSPTEPTAFFVTGGRVAVSTATNLSVYNSLTLELLFSVPVPEGKTAVGLPLISFDSLITTLSDNSVLKIPFDSPTSPEVFPVSQVNSLKYNVLDAKDNLYFCSDSGVNKLSLTTGVMETVVLSSYSLVCSNVVITNKDMIMISATSSSSSSGSHSFKSALYELSSDFSSSSSSSSSALLPTPLITFSDVVSHLSRTAFYSNGVLTVKTAVATDRTVEVFTQFPDLNSDVEQTIVIETEAPVTNFLSLSTKAEPAFSLSSSESGSEFFLYEVTVFPPEKVSESYFSPLLFSNLAAVFMDTKGTAVLFGYCNRYKLGEEIPDDRACPFADLPDKGSLDPVLIILATGGAALFLPLGTKLICKITKSDRKKEDFEKEAVPETN